MRKMSIEEVIETMEQEVTYYGFRGASKTDLERLEDSEYLGASLDLWDEHDCDYQEEAEKLDGTSAICITEYMNTDEIKRRFEQARGYAKNHHGTNTVLFVCGDFSESGDDGSEVVLRCDFEEGAKVLAEVVL